MKKDEFSRFVFNLFGIIFLASGFLTLILLMVFVSNGVTEITILSTTFACSLTLIIFGSLVVNLTIKSSFGKSLGELRILLKDLDKFIEELSGTRRLHVKIRSEMENVANINKETIDKYVRQAELNLKKIIDRLNESLADQLQKSNTEKAKLKEDLENMLESMKEYCDDIYRIIKQNSEDKERREIYQKVFELIRKRFKKAGFKIILPKIGTDSDEYKHIKIVETVPSEYSIDKIVEVKKIGYEFNNNNILESAEVTISNNESKNEITEQKITEDEERNGENNETN